MKLKTWLANRRLTRALDAKEKQLGIAWDPDRRRMVRAGGVDLHHLPGLARRAGDGLAELVLDDDHQRLDPARIEQHELLALRLVDRQVAARESELWGVAPETAEAAADALRRAIRAIAEYERARRRLVQQYGRGIAA